MHRSYAGFVRRSVALGLLLWTAGVRAGDESVGFSRILDIGCHNVNGTCYVTLDTAPFGASTGCPKAPTNQFRFDNGDTAVGRLAYATLLAAFMANKHVAVQLSGCTYQGMPALQYYQVR